MTRFPVVLRIPEPLLEVIDARAQGLGVTRHALLLRLLEAGLENEERWRDELRERLEGLI